MGCSGGQAVSEELLERGVQIAAGGFVLPRKRTALENISLASTAADDGAFFFKQIAVRAARLGHAEQITQVNKVALRALLFVEVIRRVDGTPIW